MIFPAVSIIQQELSNELNPIPVTVDLGNITEIVTDLSSGTNADIIISLINIEENRVSRELDYYVKKDNGGIIKKNPAIHLYFTLLFTSVKPTAAYGKSLQNLQHVIEFFQKKFVFDHSNTPGLHANIEKLILEMVTLNLQQLHEIWSVLGGKYYPSVMYRVRMVTIDSITDMEGAPVKEVILNF